MLAIIDSSNTVMVYENNFLIGYLLEHFDSRKDAMEYASQLNCEIICE